MCSSISRLCCFLFLLSALFHVYERKATYSSHVVCSQHLAIYQKFHGMGPLAVFCLDGMHAPVGTFTRSTQGRWGLSGDELVPRIRQAFQNKTRHPFPNELPLMIHWPAHDLAGAREEFFKQLDNALGKPEDKVRSLSLSLSLSSP